MKSFRRVTNQASRWTLALYLAIFALAGVGHPCVPVAAACDTHDGGAIVAALAADSNSAHHCPSCAIVSAVAGGNVATREVYAAPLQMRGAFANPAAGSPRALRSVRSTRGPPIT